MASARLASAGRTSTPSKPVGAFMSMGPRLLNHLVEHEGLETTPDGRIRHQDLHRFLRGNALFHGELARLGEMMDTLGIEGKAFADTAE